MLTALIRLAGMITWSLAAARQQLAELEAAGPCLQKAFHFRILGGVQTPPLFPAPLHYLTD